MRNRVIPVLLYLVILAAVISVGVCDEDPATVGADATLGRALTNSAIEKLAQEPTNTQADILRNIKAGTDGIQLAAQSAVNHDTSRMLKGVGDALSALPGAFGFSGIAFSLAASVFAFLGGSNHEDPVLTALHELQTSFKTEMTAIKSTLKDLNQKATVIITGIDKILNELSAVPAKVVAEMKLTDVTTMKDKFTAVQHASEQYAQGSLSRDQMIAKCDDFRVASLFSELETIVNDEHELFSARFGANDRAQATAQLQLLVFYMSVVPLATNCNALRYPIESLTLDGTRIDGVIKAAYSRAVWYLTAPDRTIFVRERFSPYDSVIDVDGEKRTDGWSRALSIKAYSFVPPHGQCVQATDNGKRLVSTPLPRASKVPSVSTFCVKNTATDDAPTRVAYAERSSTLTGRKFIMQPEVGSKFDGLKDRGWTQNTMNLYVSTAADWTRLATLRVISDLVIMQADDDKVSIDEITGQCRSLGAGYDRDGDAHSKDYKNAPWTIFCVRYATLTLREIDDASWKYLSDIQFIDMPSSDAWKATCPAPGFQRDRNQITIPSKIQKQWFGGTSTLRAYAVCLKWEAMTTSTPPNRFIERVWFDDSLPMANKPQSSRHSGDQPLGITLSASN